MLFAFRRYYQPSFIHVYQYTFLVVIVMRSSYSAFFIVQSALRHWHSNIRDVTSTTLDRERVSGKTNMADTGAGPRDAAVMEAILREMGVEDYEPNVIHQMLEFSYSKWHKCDRIIGCVLRAWIGLYIVMVIWLKAGTCRMWEHFLHSFMTQLQFGAWYPLALQGL